LAVTVCEYWSLGKYLFGELCLFFLVDACVLVLVSLVVP
jgi:hypothetical protein